MPSESARRARSGPRRQGYDPVLVEALGVGITRAGETTVGDEGTASGQPQGGVVVDRPVVPRLGHVPGFDGLRGVAVALVLLVHTGNVLWPEASAWLARGGALGVHLFFVLGGFLITALLLEERERRGTIWLGGFFAGPVDHGDLLWRRRGWRRRAAGTRAY